MDSLSSRDALQPLIGLPLSRIGRASSLLWMHFGKLSEIALSDGRTKTVGDWAVHVQCSWRLARKGAIVLASRDFYRTNDGQLIGGDWENSGESKFDRMVKTINQAPPWIIRSIDCDNIGGFKLNIGGEFNFDVFPDSSAPGELWRLLQPSTPHKHFVVKSNRDGQVLGIFE